MLEEPLAAEINWCKLQLNIATALGSGDSTPSSFPDYSCSAAVSLQDESVTADPTLELG